MGEGEPWIGTLLLVPHPAAMNFPSLVASPGTSWEGTWNAKGGWRPGTSSSLDAQPALGDSIGTLSLGLVGQCQPADQAQLPHGHPL